MAAHLIFGSPGTAGRRVSLERNLSIGSDEGLDIVLSDPSAKDVVADRHASLVHREGGWFLRDESGLAGTFLNDRRITGDHRLSDGDVIEFGLGGPEATFLADDRTEGKGVGTGSDPPETLQFRAPDDAVDAVNEHETPYGAGPNAAVPGVKHRARIWFVGLVLLIVVAAAAWWWTR